MSTDDIRHFTDQTFEAEVLDASLPVLVDFWAPWCGPCRVIAPVVDRLASKYRGRANVGKLDIDQNRATTWRYGVRTIPTLAIFKGGRIVEQLVGRVPEKRIAEALEKYLEAPEATG